MSNDTRPVDVVVSSVNHSTLKVAWRPDLGMSISPTGIDGARWTHDSRAWTLPALGAYTLLPFFRTNFPTLRVSFDADAARVIHEQLNREVATTSLAMAEDGDVPEVLSVQSRNFQRAALAYLLKGVARKILALDTGLGKTFVACSYARIRKTKTLWVTKASLVNNLETEIFKLMGERVVRLLGSEPNAAHLDILSDPRHKHFIITYDVLSRSLINIKDGTRVIDHVSKWAIFLRVAGFELCVVDEAHNIKSRNSNRWKVVRMLKDIPSFLFLTATPMVNVGTDLFSLANIIAPETFSSETEFTRSYLSADGRNIRNPKRLQADMLPYMFRRKKTDVLKDLPPKIRHVQTVEVSPEWHKRYDDILAGIYQDWNGNEREVPDSVLAQINRFRQVASQSKVEHTAEFARELEEDGQKTLIFTAFRESAEEIAKELYCDYIHGGTDFDKRTEIQQKFQTDPNVKHLVLTLDTGREGLNLTAASAVIFNDYGWNEMTHDQAEGRAWGRLNDPHGLLVYYVSADVDIEKFMMDTLKRKQEMAEAGVDGQRVYVTNENSMLREFLRFVRENRG